MNLNNDEIHNSQMCVCNYCHSVPNPTQYTKFDKYNVKTKKRDWSEISPKYMFCYWIALCGL